MPFRLYKADIIDPIEKAARFLNVAKKDYQAILSQTDGNDDK